MMKKIICMVFAAILVFSSPLEIKAAGINEITNEYKLEKVVELPQNIKPIYVENEEELAELLGELEAVYGDKGDIVDNINNLEVRKSDITTFNQMAARSTQLVNNKTLTHTETIFDLSNIGGKIVSKVNYTYSYWVAPEKYRTTINYHDVYETGIYGCQEITYTNKTATTNGPTITVNVRGYSKVYIGLSGGGASGNLVLKTFPFDKTYTIYTGM